MIPLPPGPFGAVLIDIPWDFKTYGGKSSVPTVAADPYQTMSLADLRKLPVGEITAKDAALIMWVVDAHLEQALALGRSWGFRYKTNAFVWVKSVGLDYALFGPEFKMGMGYWTRKESEQCLFFTKGRPKRLHADVRQIIDQPTREHSRKPDDQYARIERLVGGPYLEMFSRTNRPGWTSWGDQAGTFQAP